MATITFKIPDDLFDSLRVCAAYGERTVSSQLRVLAREFVDKHGEEPFAAARRAKQAGKSIIVPLDQWTEG